MPFSMLLLQLAGISLPPDKRRGRLILPCLLSAVESLSHNTCMLQTPPHSMPTLFSFLSLCKLVNCSTTTIIKLFWLITPFNWTIAVDWAKWHLVSSAAEHSGCKKNKQANRWGYKQTPWKLTWNVEHGKMQRQDWPANTGSDKETCCNILYIYTSLSYPPHLFWLMLHWLNIYFLKQFVFHLLNTVVREPKYIYNTVEFGNHWETN